MVWIDAPISNTKKRWTDRPTGWWTCSRGEEGLPFSNWHRTPDYRTYYITIVDDYPVNHDCIWLLALNIQWWLGHPSDPNAVMIADGVVDVPQCVSVTWPTKVRLEQARATPSASCPAYSGARGPRNLRMWNVFGNYTMDKSNRFPVWNWIMTRFSVCVCFPCGKLVMWYSATFFIVFGMFHDVFYLQFRLPGASCLANCVVSVFDPVWRWATSVIAGTCWILAHCAFNFGAWRCNLPYATRNNWFCSESATGFFDWVHMQKANYHLRILTAVTSPIVCY